MVAARQFAGGFPVYEGKDNFLFPAGHFADYFSGVDDCFEYIFSAVIMRKRNWYRIAAFLLALVMAFGLATGAEARRVKGAPPPAKGDKVMAVKGVPVPKGKRETPATKKDSPKWNLSNYQKEYGPLIRIALTRGAGLVQLGAGGKFTVYDGNKVWKSYSSGTVLQVSRSGGLVTVNGKCVGKTVYIRSDEVRVVTYNGKPYRGVLRVIPTVGSSGLTVINELGLESYLYGVVPSEVPAEWEDNALRAQAVAARTYALNRMGTYDLQGFDMLDTASQEYGGMNAEAAKTTAAVNATRGEVVTYNGKLIDAVFCTYSGGYTENSEFVWGNPIPYLKAVPEPTNAFTAKEWVVPVTLQHLEKVLAQAGKDPGKLKKIQLSKLKKAPMKARDRGLSGRVLEVTFVGKKKTVKVSGNSMRELFGLKSTMFDFRAGKKKDELEIFGYGYGHGVGMSQWGAQVMAQKHRNEPFYYREILAHFYQGIKVEKKY